MAWISLPETSAFQGFRLSGGDTKSDNSPNETLPLLLPSNRDHSPSHPCLRTVAICLCIIFLRQMSASIGILSHFRLYEVMLTEANYQSEQLTAKYGLSQTEFRERVIFPRISFIQGWQVTFDCIPDILLLIIFAYTQRKISRSILLSVNCGAAFLAEGWIILVGWSGLPLEWTWCSSLFRFLGGDSRVAIALVSSLLSDATMPSDRYTSHITITLLVAELVGSAVTPLLMAYSLNASLLLGLILPLVALPLAIVISSDTWPLGTRQPTSGKRMEEHELPSWSTPSLQQLGKPDSVLRSDLRVSWLVATCLISRIGRYPFALLLQAVSHRYRWVVSETGYLVVLRAATSLVWLLILNHFIRPLFARRRSPTDSSDTNPPFSPYLLDLWTVRSSALCLAASCVLLSLSSSAVTVYAGIVLYALGIGFGTGSRGLLAQWTTHECALPDNMLEAVSDAIAAPMMSYTYALGAQLGSPLLSLPFVASASMFGLIAIGTMLVGGD
ncbi:hypothetical protein BO71DRAFT_486853 [Aspergillus ellipticus CBS 707.79]|uniref:MFS general substrate transporter n=1 Tax=Aspergillus ellipticus CBS 707.79 TaxID=1448320 RepID=A0A319D8D4_9EURO|nr:hypothetical protein BO71DRAFT_486853 [Aspergillus ellipticus CBS 707.79]